MLQGGTRDRDREKEVKCMLCHEYETLCKCTMRYLC